MNRYFTSTGALNSVHESFRISSAAAWSLYSAVQSRRMNANRKPLAYHPKGLPENAYSCFSGGSVAACTFPSRSAHYTHRRAPNTERFLSSNTSRYPCCLSTRGAMVKFLYPSAWVAARSLGRGDAAYLTQTCCLRAKK